LNEITPNIAWHPERDALDDYLASLERVGELEVDLIFPAHGEPFSGHRKWIEETAAHHRERCGLIVAAAAGGARTAHEMAGRLWARRLDPIHHHFAVFEVMAHLEYMRRRGRVDAAERDGVMDWRATEPASTS
jgi:glyoxylase-like metal-dependent hydrolase (beta-lactamase superfamily II)